MIGEGKQRELEILSGEKDADEAVGAALGLMITINAGCATLGTPIFGYIIDRTGS